MIDAATLSQASLGFGVLAGGNFDTCFRELFPRVARTAALVSRDPGLGPDVAQEAFARLFERWDRIAFASDRATSPGASGGRIAMTVFEMRPDGSDVRQLAPEDDGRVLAPTGWRA